MRQNWTHRSWFCRLALVSALLISGCGEDREVDEDVKLTVTRFHRALQSHDADALWSVIDANARGRLNERAGGEGQDPGKRLLRESFQDSGSGGEATGAGDLGEIQFIRSRRLYGLMQCLVKMKYKGKDERNVITLRKENGEWRIVLDLMGRVDRWTPDEVLLVIEPGGRGEHGPELLDGIWDTDDREERERNAANLLGETLTFTGEVLHAVGGLAMDPHLMVQVGCDGGGARQVAVYFDEYQGAGQTYHFQGGKAAEITLPPEGEVVRINEGDTISVTGVVAGYSAHYDCALVYGAFLFR